MILRIALFLSMAFGIVGIAGVGWLATREQRPAVEAVTPIVALPPPPAPREQILTASKPLRAGSLLKSEDIAQQDIVKAEAPGNAVVATRTARSDMVGAMLRRSLQPGEPVLSTDVMLPGDHGFLAAVLQPGMRAATVAVDAVSGSAGLIWPGDQVDLVLTQAIEDPKVAAGHRLAAERVLDNLRVVAVDQQLMRGAQPGADGQAARTITLEATPEQAEKIAIAQRIGKIQLVVRSAQEPQAAAAPAVPLGPPPSPVAAKPAKPPVSSSTVWASDVSKVINGDGTGGLVRVFGGATDGKEFHFQ